MWIFKDVQTTLRLTQQSNGHTPIARVKRQLLRLLSVIITIMAEAVRPIGV